MNRRRLFYALGTLSVAAGMTVGALTLFLGSPSKAKAQIQLRFFDATAEPSHILPDDPLKFPGQHGASHEHLFFCNTTTNADSTGESLLVANMDQAHTTCHDKLDGSGYWLPCLYQDGGSSCYMARRIHVYYKDNKDYITHPAVAPPTGFGMISSDHDWTCLPGAQDLDEAPSTCPSGKLRVTIHFPDCWNGVDLFKLDGSHVTNSISKDEGCPASHPYLIPSINMQEDFNVDSISHTYELATTPGGGRGPTNTAHGDFFGAWDPDHFKFMIDHCLNVPDAPPDCNRD